MADDRGAMVNPGGSGGGASGAGRHRDVRFEFRVHTVQGPEAEALARQQVTVLPDVMNWVALQREQSRASESTSDDEDGPVDREPGLGSSPREE
ncbi:hypothetical protein GTZ89_01745 [Streptomyces sp. SID8382]|uniref:hypothetical protein n=1 Tax=Streptomyces TaxID=1883 RepID=UPI00114CCC42|nr:MULTISPECIES: hypothetical protein [unclassified Streptomyces]MYX54486.1 hypothetical protein [Streptomyces sp. SID8382]